MAVYSYKCDNGHNFQVEASLQDGPPDDVLCKCQARTTRNYKADFASAQFFVPGYMASWNTTSRSDFLPTTKDFESPTDPTGENGMKKWKDDHVRKGFREI